MTVLKLIGGLGLFGACLGIGRYYSHRLYRRVALLNAAQSLCRYAASQIEYGCTPFRDIWRTACTLPQFEIFPFLKDADTAVWKDVIRKGFSLYESRELTTADVCVLVEWVQGLGGSDVQGQIEHAARCSERITQELVQARERADKAGKLYPMLGGLCGAAAVMLIW